VVDSGVGALAAGGTVDAGTGAAVNAGVGATDAADGVLIDVAGDEPSLLHDVAAAAPITAMAIDPMKRTTLGTPPPALQSHR
jgi:hypothetical protein